MSNRKKRDAIGFPPPLLGEKPLRTPVISESEGWIAIEKPAEIGMRPHPWDETLDLDKALNLQLQEGKPELLRRGASLFGSVYYLDPAISGVALFAKDRDTLAQLKNAFGSGDIRFTFYFITASTAGRLDDRLVADAPLLPHNVKPKMIPSTAKGKKSTTHFGRIDSSSKGWDLWKGSVCFFRPHQIRCHAATAGFPIMGDTTYGGPDAPLQRSVHPSKQRAGMSLKTFYGVALHLHEVRFEYMDLAAHLIAPLPKHFRLLVRRLGLSDQALEAPPTVDE